MAEQRRSWLAAGWAACMVGLLFVAIGMTEAGIGSLLGWSFVLAVASWVDVQTDSGNRMSFAFAVAAALPMVLGDGQGADLAAVVCVYAVGYLGGWLLARLEGRVGDERRASTVIRNSVGAFVYAFVFDGLSAASGDAELGRLLAFAVAGLLWFSIEETIWSLVDIGRERLTLSYLGRLMMGDLPVAFSMFTVGGLAGLSWPVLGWWTALVAIPPFVFAYVAFQRSAQARKTYHQTIRALSRIPEVAGLSPIGHSDRTATLAVAIGRELGMSPQELRDLEYAARMHDIGRITLTEPNIIKAGFTEDDIARWGSEIIAESSYLDHVARLVRLQHQPYRRPGEQKDPDLPLSSKVIRAASAYDHAVNELGFSPLEALEVMHRGAAYDYDPEVVEAVRAVVEMRLAPVG